MNYSEEAVAAELQSKCGRVVKKCNKSHNYHLLLSVTALILLISAGCDDRPKRVPVSGIVLVDGKPLTKGSVTFVPAGQRPSAAKVDADGKFTLQCYDGGDGTVLGTHRVQVSGSEILQGGKVKWHAPNKYSDFRRSGLTVEVTEPVDDLVIELTWDGENKPRKKK